jgi:hypothetical protein
VKKKGKGNRCRTSQKQWRKKTHSLKRFRGFLLRRSLTPAFSGFKPPFNIFPMLRKSVDASGEWTRGNDLVLVHQQINRLSTWNNTVSLHSDFFFFGPAGREPESGALAIVTVFAVATLASLIELRGGAVAAVSLGQIKTHQLRAIELIFLPSKDAGDATGNSRKNLHGAR